MNKIKDFSIHYSKYLSPYNPFISKVPIKPISPLISPKTYKEFSISERNFLIIGVCHRFSESSINCISAIDSFQPDSIILETSFDRLQLIEQITEQYKDKFNKELPKLEKSRFYLFKSGLEFIFPVLYSKNIDKYVQLLPGDIAPEKIVEEIRQNRLLCKCKNKKYGINISFKILKKQLLYFFYKFIGKNIMINEDIAFLMEEYRIEKGNCIELKIFNERDERIFRYAVKKSSGTNILIIVGMLHLKNLENLFLKYKEFEESENRSKIYENLLENEMKFKNLDQVKNHLKNEEEEFENFLKNIRKEKKYCNEYKDYLFLYYLKIYNIIIKLYNKNKIIHVFDIEEILILSKLLSIFLFRITNRIYNN